MDATSLRAWLTNRIADLAGVEARDLDPTRPLADLGLSSEQAVQVSADLETLLGRTLGAELLYAHATIEALARHLTETQTEAAPTIVAGAPNEPIAIVGIGCAFPGAGVGPAAFLDFLRRGGDAIREVPAERWDAQAIYDPDPAAVGKACTRWGSFLDGVDQFEPGAFGISPAEAARMDPQQRLLLEAAWHAMEDAGLAPSSLAGSRTGVFVGVSHNEYGRERFRTPAAIDAVTATGNALSIAANRISYVYDLQGPSVAVDTACSSSLAAVHLACQSLRAGEATLALAGGVNVILSPDISVAFSRAGVMSPDGRCKPFDARANGYVRGEGVGVVALKPLRDAQRDGDAIYAVILGSAMHQDGRSNGLMAPRGPAQEAAIVAACRAAGVAPGELDYVEAHGTGTALGDVIEARALGATVGRRAGAAPCRIGSVKSNLGHLEAAAGIAGLIKAALGLHAGELFPTLHFQTANPAIDCVALGLEVSDRAQPWPGGPRRLAGVSSFGFGGTNVHAILEGPPSPPTATPGPSQTVLALSARDDASLQALAAAYAAALDDVAATSHAGLAAGATKRGTHRSRLAIALETPADAAAALRRFSAGESDPRLFKGRAAAGRQVGFVFSGQGGLSPGAGQRLFQSEPAYRDRMLECDGLLRPLLGGSVLTALFSPNSQALLSDTRWAQPALFAVQMALAALLESWGLSPAACLGHSVGEVAAAAAARRLTLAEAATVVALRGRCMAGEDSRGRMALLLADAATVSDLVAGQPDVCVAAENGPTTFVISGSEPGVARVLSAAEARGVQAHLVPVDLAAHGPAMEGPAARLRIDLADTGLTPPGSAELAFYSSVRGARLEAEPLASDYWAENVRRPVLFRQAVEAMVRDGVDTFVEIGPHPTLLREIAGALEGAAEPCVVGTLDRRSDDLGNLHATAARLFVQGALPTLSRLAPAPPVLSAPPYVWAGKTTTWLEPSADAGRGPLRGFLEPPVDLAVETGVRVWSGRLDARSEPRFAECVAAGEPAVPATAWLDMLFTAAAAVGGEHAELHDVRLPAPVPLPDAGPLEVQVASVPAPGRGSLLKAFRRGQAGEPWTLSASALVATPGPPPDAPSAAAARRGAARPGDDLYAAAREAGLDQHGGYRVLSQVWAESGEAFGELGHGLALASTAHAADCRVAEAAWRVVAAAAGPALWQPTAIARAWRDPRPTPVAGVGAKILGTGGGGARADVAFVDGAGAVLMSLEGVELHDAGASIAAQGAVAAAARTWVRAVTWPQAPAAPTPASTPALTGLRLILSGAGGPADRLAETWRSRGARCVLIRPGDTPQRGSSDEHIVRPGNVEDLCAVLAEFGGAPSMEIVYAWSLPGPSAIADPAVLASVLQAVRRRDAGGAAGVTVLTDGAWRLPDDIGGAPEQATLWGLARAAALEFPDVRLRCIDVRDAASRPDRMDRTCAEVDAPDEEDQIAWRDDGRRVARLEPAAFGHAAQLATDGVYLITGGSGALAGHMAHALAAAGAGTVVLAARSLTAGIEPIETPTGTRRIARAPCDVTDVSAVRELVMASRAYGTLRGVIHAAGRLDDGAIVNLSPERFARVLAPKVDGIRALEAALRGTDLDVLVLASSAASVLGSPGQGNYCAGNAYLDAFALARRDVAKRVVSLSWGPWAGDGMAQVDGQATADRFGLAMIPPQIGAALSVRAMSAPSGHYLVTAFDPLAVGRALSPGRLSPLLSGLAATAGHELFERAPARAAPRPALSTEFVAPRTVVEERLAEIFTGVLGATGLGVRDDLFELGGDSISATQILSLANQAFGVRLPGEAAFACFTIEGLAELVESALLDRIADLDEAEVERLLAAGEI